MIFFLVSLVSKYMSQFQWDINTILQVLKKPLTFGSCVLAYIYVICCVIIMNMFNSEKLTICEEELSYVIIAAIYLLYKDLLLQLTILIGELLPYFYLSFLVSISSIFTSYTWTINILLLHVQLYGFNSLAYALTFVPLAHAWDKFRLILSAIVFLAKYVLKTNLKICIVKCISITSFLGKINYFHNMQFFWNNEAFSW